MQTAALTAPQKILCAHVAGENIGEATTALESDESGDFFREVVSIATREHESQVTAHFAWMADVMWNEGGEHGLPSNFRQQVYAEVHGKDWHHRWNAARVGV